MTKVIDRELKKKYEKLKNDLSALPGLAVSFSAGVDSSLLLTVAAEVLGEKVLALTAVSPSFPQRELTEAETFCKERNIRQLLVLTNEMKLQDYRRNPSDRCYYCKKELFTEMKTAARDNGFEYLAEGSNLDDLGDHRPGSRAVNELGILRPLLDAGLTKADVRDLSRFLALPTWDKPSYACLASRLPYGESIEEEKLKKIEIAEDHLIGLGFRQVRVRLHRDIARIEVPAEEIEALVSQKETVLALLKECGFPYIAVDLRGFRSGSLNESIKKEKTAE